MRDRKRMVHSNISTSDKFGAVSFQAESLFHRLLTFTDDYGNVRGGVGYIKDVCFPKKKNSVHKNNDIRYDDVEDWLSELVGTGLLAVYEHDGIEYLHFRRFEEFQKLRADRMFKECPDFEAATSPQPSGNQVVTDEEPDENQSAAHAGAGAAGEVEVRREKREEEKKELQAAPKKKNQLSAVPPDAAAAFSEKFGKEVKAVLVEVMDPGGSVPEEYQQTTNDDYLDIAIRVVWIRAQRGKKFDDPNAYAHSLANTYKMSPEEFARGMKTVADYELIQAYKAAEQQKALEKQAQAELDQAESDKKNREYLELLEKFDELPEFDQKAIESFAVEAFRDDGNHYQPPAIKSLPMRPYFLEAFKAHMGVFE